MGTVFASTSIVVFKEFELFTGVTSTYQTFQRSTIQEVVFPASITTIGGYTFFYCSSLKKMTIQANVTAINGNTFQGSNNLTTTIIYATTPPTLSQQARLWFRGTIYVPDDSVEAYRAAAEWSNIASRIVGISEYDG